MTHEALGAILLVIQQMNGTPYIPGGNSPAGTDCSGLASIVANVASGREPFSGRFTTANQGAALAARGFSPGSAPGALVIGWNSGHTAVTLPDGTSVSSGESGSGVRFGGAGAYQPQFTQRMHIFLPAPTSAQHMDPPPAEPESFPEPEHVGHHDSAGELPGPVAH